MLTPNRCTRCNELAGDQPARDLRTGAMLCPRCAAGAPTLADEAAATGRDTITGELRTSDRRPRS